MQSSIGVTPPLIPHQPTQPQLAPTPTNPNEICTLWIGDLQFWMDEHYVFGCFAKTNKVVNVKLIRNKQTSQLKGYGFIEFISREEAERALQTFNGTLMPNVEQNFRLNWASAGEKRGDGGAEYSIFVGDLAPDVTDYVLQETFRQRYGSVKGAKVVTDHVTGRAKGYGFVKFGDESEQQRAMTKMNGQLCSSRPMRIRAAANRSALNDQQCPRGSYQTSQGNPTENDPNNTTVPVRSCAEQALQMLNGTHLEGQSIRLSWGHPPSNRQNSAGAAQTVPNLNGWNNGYYGHGNGNGYQPYGYAPPAPQGPNLYNGGGYPGYGNYQQPSQHQQ